MCGVAGFDFVLLDCEHGPSDMLPVRRHIVAAQAHGMGVLVRIGANEWHLALKALDHGADGLVAPHVDQAAQAAELVDAAHYPPLGERGFATYSRAGAFGTYGAEEHHRRMTERTVLIVMVESPRAVENVADILSVPGIDGYLVGPSDLNRARACDDPSVEELTRRAHSRASGSGAARADIVGSMPQAHESRADGAGLIVYNLTKLLMDTLIPAAQLNDSGHIEGWGDEI